MSAVSLTSITVLDNPTKITNPFQFDIVFECVSPLNEDLEFKIVYVGSAEDNRYDQVLDSIMVGPVPVGINKFVFQADAPNFSLIPSSEILGATVVLIVCSYNNQEFIRVGYYVNNEYDSEELQLTPPETIQLDRIVRNILSDKPRVTRIPIRWDNSVDPEILPPSTALDGAELVEADDRIGDGDESFEDDFESDVDEGEEEDSDECAGMEEAEEVEESFTNKMMVTAISIRSNSDL